MPPSVLADKTFLDDTLLHSTAYLPDRILDCPLTIRLHAHGPTPLGLDVSAAWTPPMATTLSGGALPPPKQIRFVNNQGQPPSKRRRVNAA